METVATTARLGSFNLEKIRSHDLSKIIHHYQDHISILSLDCFDTLIWRKTTAPADVFYSLQHKPAFKSLGLNAEMRVRAESNARVAQIFKLGHHEIKLTDIYLASFPTLNPKQLDALSEDEIATEHEFCYAFPPMINLIRDAHQAGLKIIITSDIYFTEPQLRRILANALPFDVMAMIDKIFCSCEHSRSKREGLFQSVIESMGVSPDRILHIGDNQEADFIAPQRLKLHALHFVQQDEEMNVLLHLQEMSSKMLDPRVNFTMPIYSPFRAVLAQNQQSAKNPEVSLGYASLGPVMYAFARFIKKEVEKLKQDGKQVKVLYLMRDGYLPSLAIEELAGEPLGQRVQISRFCAFAASFRSKEDILNYFIEIGQTNRYDDLARQLLLPEPIAQPIIHSALNSRHPTFEFIRQILQPDILKLILHLSAEFRTRLMSYLKKRADIQTGDTVVLVDLGYSGTAQRRLTPVFQDLGIEIIGRYLISLSVPGWEANRRGLLDPTCYDDRAMQSLVIYITMFEQLCTTNERSVVNYDDDGDPVYSPTQMNQNQYDKLRLIQDECLRFIRDAKKFFAQYNIDVTDEMFQQTTVSNISRLIYLSTESELNYLKSFEAEMNLGTNDILRVFDMNKGLSDLRKRGMFYMENPSISKRTNYPAEIRSIGMELSLSLMAQHRYSLYLKLNDMVLKREKIGVTFIRGHETHQTSVEAISTHEGYFALLLPAGTGNTQITVHLGQSYQFVQIENAELIVLEAFIKQNETNNVLDVQSCLTFDKMVHKGEKLFECLQNESSVTMKPTMQLPPLQYIYRLIFRPIVKQYKPSPAL
ncbi:MAG: hypothetical protein ACYCQI_02745 [Gammaproteobacteria bacterium]